MTNREFFEAIANAQNIDAELVEFATDAIAKLDHTNELRREKNIEKNAAKAAEKAPIREALMAAMSDEPKTASQLIEATGLDIKPASIPSLLKPMIESGAIAKTDIKVSGKGSVRGYVLA